MHLEDDVRVEGRPPLLDALPRRLREGGVQVVRVIGVAPRVAHHGQRLLVDHFALIAGLKERAQADLSARLIHPGCLGASIEKRLEPVLETRLETVGVEERGRASEACSPYDVYSDRSTTGAEGKGP